MVSEFEIFEKAMQHVKELQMGESEMGALTVGDIVGTLFFARDLITENEELSNVLEKEIRKMLIIAVHVRMI